MKNTGMAINDAYVDVPDKTDGQGYKLRRAVQQVEQQYDDRFPARGLANVRGGNREYAPLDDVSRGNRTTEYLKRPSASRR